MLEIELPYPPSVNHYWRRVGARTLISREGRRFRQNVIAIVMQNHIRPLYGQLAVEVVLYPPDNRRRDLDNVLKSLLDALERAGVYHDDGQIVRLSIAKCDPAPGGKAIVRISHLT